MQCNTQTVGASIGMCYALCSDCAFQHAGSETATQVASIASALAVRCCSAPGRGWTTDANVIGPTTDDFSLLTVSDPEGYADAIENFRSARM
jgi:hypothetical protein